LIDNTVMCILFTVCTSVLQTFHSHLVEPSIHVWLYLYQLVMSAMSCQYCHST